MSDDDTGHCKDREHVRVLTGATTDPADRGIYSAVYVGHTSCVNMPGYTGWVVQFQHRVGSKLPKPGLRMLPDLAEVMPTWLRRAAHRAADASVNVEVQHTFDKVWRTYAVVTPADARRLAESVLAALALTPPGVNG